MIRNLPLCVNDVVVASVLCGACLALAGGEARSSKDRDGLCGPLVSRQAIAVALRVQRLVRADRAPLAREHVFGPLVIPKRVDGQTYRGLDGNLDHFVYWVRQYPVRTGTQKPLFAHASNLAETQHNRLLVGADRLEAGSQKGDDQHDHDDFEDNKADPQRLGETLAGGVELIAGGPLRRPGKLILIFFVILFGHNIRCIELLLNFCKIEVRHILFQKIGFTIF